MSTNLRFLAGQSLPAIGLGCMSLSQAYYPLPTEQDAEKLLHRALDLGYRHFDSARLYGLGHNERLLSGILRHRRDEMFITSKCGIEFDDGQRRIDCSPATIRRAVDKSLSAMGVETIDLYYLHRRDFSVPIEDSVGALAELKAEGKIGAIGLSEMSADTIRRAAAAHPVDAVQTEYSLWTRNAEIAVLETCRELGIAFVAFSPVARGALAGAVSDPSTLDDRDLRKNHPRFTADHWPSNKRLVDRFVALAAEAGTSPAQLAIAWVLSRGEHVHAIPGTHSLAHLEENFAARDLAFPDDILTAAGNLVNQATVSGHRYPDAMRKTIDTEEFALA